MPHIEEVTELDNLSCACGGCLTCIGEVVSERLGIVPARSVSLAPAVPKMPAVYRPREILLMLQGRTWQ